MSRRHDISAGNGPGDLCIRADTSPRIGTGHVMRCLALAQAWKDLGGGANFLGSQESGLLRERILNEGFRWVDVPGPHPDPADLETTLAFLSGRCTSGGRWAVLDGYHFDERYHEAVRAASHRLLVIDDTGHLSEYHADIVLNQSMPAGMVCYPADPGTRLLLGQRYVLLRREFLKGRAEARRHPQTARNILVTLGGADPGNTTRRVVEALNLCSLPGLSVKVVLGASNPHRARLRQSAASASFDCRIVDATDRMPELMAWADMAVSAGGTTCWEMAFLGLPNLVLVIAKNQEPVAEVLRLAGCSSILEDPEDTMEMTRSLKRLIHDRERREGMSRKGSALIDGLGSRRVVEEMLTDG